MEFSPTNHVVKRCIQGMAMKEKDNPVEAGRLFFQAWNEASDDFEKFLAAYFVAGCQDDAGDKLRWWETALRLASAVNDDGVKAAFPSLYRSIAQCYEELGDPANAKKNYASAASFSDKPADKGPFYHGTKADLQVGDLLTAGGRSNYKTDVIMNHIYFTALVSGAGLAAGLAGGEGPGHVYIVEPTGSFENDPNVTNKKFPGNPTRSYRSRDPLKIVGELTDWTKQTPEELQRWREKLANSKGNIIN